MVGARKNQWDSFSKKFWLLRNDEEKLTTKTTVLMEVACTLHYLSVEVFIHLNNG